LKQIAFTGEAKADIRAIPRNIAMNILAAIHRLAETGSGNIKALQHSEPPEYRLRAGDFRVRFTHESGDAYR
jgi:mRNA-degrading endonuclease RelE of RelBE toxin-antitoxin system